SILSYHFCNLSFLAALHLIILFVEEFGISEKQAEALLDITLRKLTILEVPGDQLKWVRRCADDDLVAIASQNGMVIVNFCNKVIINIFRGVILMRLEYAGKIQSASLISASVDEISGD
ncbi:hypothetical protein GW17_00004400, partial [Ensete ventricosum]